MVLHKPKSHDPKNFSKLKRLTKSVEKWFLKNPIMTSTIAKEFKSVQTSLKEHNWQESLRTMEHPCGCCCSLGSKIMIC